MNILSFLLEDEKIVSLLVILKILKVMHDPQSKLGVHIANLFSPKEIHLS